jgi:hypothetical protein
MLKNILDYILVEERLNAFFLHIAWVLPLAGVILGAAAGLYKKHLFRLTFRGFLWGLSGTAIYLMWLVYNAITNHYGIDSVKGLLVNIAVFVCVGLTGGIALRYLNRRKS